MCPLCYSPRTWKGRLAVGRTCILVVDDEPINLDIVVENLIEEGYDVVSATAGEEAWQLIEATPQRFDVILLDRMMPDIDGIEVLRRVKAQPGMLHTPVVMQTGMTADSDIAEGLRAGAFYYLTKPFSADTLLAIVSAAVRDRQGHLDLQRETEQLGRSLSCLRAGHFVFRSPEEARSIATLAANVAPDAGRVVLGLSELMLNAVEHGNLAIGYAEKTRLIESGDLHDEILRRLTSDAFGSRAAELFIERSDGEISYLIRDQGSGFDWSSYLEMNPERAFDTHGRGIAMSRMLSFDGLDYLGRGNEVRAVVRL